MTFRETYVQLRLDVQRAHDQGAGEHDLVEVLLALAAFVATTPITPTKEDHSNVVMCVDCFIKKSESLHDRAMKMPHFSEDDHVH